VRRLAPESLAVLLRLTGDFPVAIPPERLALAEHLAAGDRPPHP